MDRVVIDKILESVIAIGRSVPSSPTQGTGSGPSTNAKLNKLTWHKVPASGRIRSRSKDRAIPSIGRTLPLLLAVEDGRLSIDVSSNPKDAKSNIVNGRALY